MTEAFTEEEMGYLGGLFDGEGHFGIAAYKLDGTHLGYRCDAQLEIGMRTKEGPNHSREMAETFFDEVVPGVNIRTVNREGHAEMWKVNTMGDSARRAMEVLKPHLRLKREVVEQIFSVEWRIVNRDKREFLKAMRIRDNLRKENNAESKYDHAYFEEALSPEATSASEVRW